MNAAYGGLGCRNGGLFPRAQRLAEAITATGRAHITSVRKAMVTNMWLNTAPDATQRFGIGPKPDGARHLTVIYGDTVRPGRRLAAPPRTHAPPRTPFSVTSKA